MNRIFLIAAALIPAIYLLIYVYRKDRGDKEPLSLLILLLVCGAFCTVPALFLEKAVGRVIDDIFRGSYFQTPDGMLFVSTGSYYRYLAADNFLGVALIEEGLKWLALVLLTRKNKNFNYLFDGLIYAVCVSLGFAAAENIIYVIEGGFQVAVLRAFTAVPSHTFDAVLMGYFYSLQHLYDGAYELETGYLQQGLLRTRAPSLKTKKYLVMSLAVPVIVHGTYDFACSASTTFWTIFFGAFLLFLYFFCFRKIKKMSKNDAETRSLSYSIVRAAHPELSEAYRYY